MYRFTYRGREIKKEKEKEKKESRGTRTSERHIEIHKRPLAREAKKKKKKKIVSPRVGFCMVDLQLLPM